MTRSVMIVAGGTGGHVYPGLAVAEVLSEAGIKLHWLGTRRGLEARVVPEHGIEFDTIPIAGLRRSGLLRWLLAPFMILLSLMYAMRVIVRIQPQVVLGMGGFVSGPGGVAAWLLRRPLVIHEQNAIPGLTNRWLSRIASRVLQAFPNTFPETRSPTVTGNPVRTEIAKLVAPGERFATRRGARILIFGGSRGALALNRELPEALAQCGVTALNILHQCGEHDVKATRERYEHACPEARIEVMAFIEDMAAAYAEADLVIARAGALTIAEIAAAGVASILVPYPFAVDDHQTANAQHLVDAGAALLVPESDLKGAELAGLIGDLLGDRARLLDMAIRARQLALPDASAVVARNCMEFVDAQR